MPSWGLVSTIKAPEEQVLAFIAYHLSLGAKHLWLYFDDPDDPVFARVAKLPRVTAKRCTPWYWALRGGRDDRIIYRQIRNAKDAQRKCRLDWLGHVDVDEFLYAPRPVAEVLAEMPATVPNLLMEPFEAMHSLDLPDDIFTARHFRGPLMDVHSTLRPAIFGRMAAVLAKGSLSHVLGKSFCRPRAPGMAIALHGVTQNKKKLRTSFHPDLRLLHFHAQDPEAWLKALPFRLTLGAYNFDEERDLQTFLSSADPDALRDFYAETMTLTPEKIALLQAHDRLITADLGLRAKVADLLAGRLR